MKLVQARELVQFQSHESMGGRAIVRRHDRFLDQQSLEQIAVAFQKQITPLVAIESLDEKPWAGHPRHQSESLLCDISGVVHLFSSEHGLLEAAEKLLAGRGLMARMAVADSVGAAWALAHGGMPCNSPPPQRLACERQAGEVAKETKKFWIVRGHQETCKAMGILPVEALRLLPATVATLSRLGVDSIQQLLTLPRSGLATRLGAGLVKRIEQAMGEVDEPLEVHRPAVEHEASLTLEYPTTDHPILADRIKRLIEKIRAGLAVRQRGALRLTCRLDLAGHPPLSLEIGLFAPTIDAEHLSGLILHQLEMKRLAACAERITISVSLSGPLRSVQNALFQDSGAHSSGAGRKDANLGRLIDALSGRLGREAVLGITIKDDPLPEQAYRVLPLAGNLDPSSFGPLRKSVTRGVSHACATSRDRVGHDLDRPEVLGPSPKNVLRRPLSLLAQPKPLRVAFQQGSFCLDVSSARLPERICFEGTVHVILMHWGPERIESGWWKGSSIRRDYYRIETDQGQWWWIFRNLVSKSRDSGSTPRFRWMLHGRFS